MNETEISDFNLAQIRNSADRPLDCTRELREIRSGSLDGISGEIWNRCLEEEVQIWNQTERHLGFFLVVSFRFRTRRGEKIGGRDERDGWICFSSLLPLFGVLLNDE